MSALRTTLRPLVRKVRNVYTRLVHPTTPLTVAGTEVRFHTPTFHLRRAVLGARGERDVIARFVQALRPDDVVWDIGGHVGTYALLAAVRAAEVHTFEPDPTPRAMLLDNIVLNGAGNVSIHEVALSDANATATLYSDGAHAFSTQSLVKIEGGAARAVTTRTGDSLRAEIPAPTVVKIDIEGAEAAALRGLADTLRLPSFRVLCVEVHPDDLIRAGSSVEAVRSFIEAAGLTSAWEGSRGTELHWIYKRPPVS